MIFEGRSMPLFPLILLRLATFTWRVSLLKIPKGSTLIAHKIHHISNEVIHQPIHKKLNHKKDETWIFSIQFLASQSNEIRNEKKTHFTVRKFVNYVKILFCALFNYVNLYELKKKLYLNTFQSNFLGFELLDLWKTKYFRMKRYYSYMRSSSKRILHNVLGGSGFCDRTLRWKRHLYGFTLRRGRGSKKPIFGLHNNRS